MHIDPALLSPASALLGALIGGGTSLIAAVYTQGHQDRIQEVTREVTKRETVYADFIMSASNLLLYSYTRDHIALSGDEQRLVGLINRMRLFAPQEVVHEAEAVLKAIIEIALEPGVDLGRLAKDALSRNVEPDPFLKFSQACRTDLDNVRRGRAPPVRTRRHKVLLRLVYLLARSRLNRSPRPKADGQRRREAALRLHRWALWILRSAIGRSRSINSSSARHWRPG